MKTLLKLSLLLFCSFAFTHCSSQSKIGKQVIISPNDLSLVFNAERVQALDPDVNILMNTMNNGRPMNILDPGYTLSIKDGKISSQLPYFGRAYNPRFGGKSENQGIYLDNKDFQVSMGYGKKGEQIFIITPIDQQRISNFILTRFDNNTAYLTVNFTDRQTVSFSGNTERFKAHP